MPNGKVEAILPPETVVNSVISVFKEFQGRLVILEIENTNFSKDSIDVSLGGYDGSNFVTKPKMTLPPTRSCGFSFNEMQIMNKWDPYSGTQALVRANQPAVFEVRNKRDKDLNYICVEPSHFPWWPPKKIVLEQTIFAKHNALCKLDGENQIVAMWYGGAVTE